MSRQMSTAARRAAFQGGPEIVPAGVGYGEIEIEIEIVRGGERASEEGERAERVWISQTEGSTT